MKSNSPLYALFILYAIGVASCATSVKPSVWSELALIPQPAIVERSYGYFLLRQGTPLIVQSNNAQAPGIAHRFAQLVERSTGVRLDVRPLGGSADQAIVFELDARRLIKGAEGYELIVSAQRIRVTAATARGLFYGGVTLWQLMTQDADPQSPIKVPAVRIEDRPQFVWRGLMLDVARHYMPPDSIKLLLDQMALHKLNTFHWHLTDDQGWRIEIKKYPRLTEVGAWRVPAGAAHAADIDTHTGKARLYGGYYSQDEVREIVRYAADRYITIVPEIDMPGHAQAAIAAYPQLGTGDIPLVSSDWGVHTYIYNVDESTFAFVEDVLSEVIELFPGQYIHVGGDEAVKDRWQSSPHVQQRMRELGVHGETQLQAYFIQRVEKFLNAHGRRLIGWDEILEGGLPAQATVMSWRGTQGAVEAARNGHDTVLSPSPDLYLDHLQSDARDEPSGRPQLITLADIYKFNPVPIELGPEDARHVLGAQANLWTEHMRTPQRVQHAAFPRAAALAEVLWSPSSRRNWNSFVQRLIAQLDRYRRFGVDYAQSAFEVRIDARNDAQPGRVAVDLTNQIDVGEIRYTLDGSEPSAASSAYRQTVIATMPLTLRAATYAQGRRVSDVQTRALDRQTVLRKSGDELRACDQRLALRLEDDAPLDGERAVFAVDILNPCWIYPGADLDAIGRIQVSVGQLPYNFQLWHDTKNIVTRAPSAADGELQIRIDLCTGPLIAEIPLKPALSNPALTTLSATLPQRVGVHDLCFVFTGKSHDPLWAIDSIQPVLR